MQINLMHFFFILLTLHAWMSLMKVIKQTSSARNVFTRLTLDSFNLPFNCFQELILELEFYTDLHDR